MKFNNGDRVEWDSRADGHIAVRHATVREDPPGKLGMLLLLPDHDPHTPDGMLCVRSDLLRYAAPAGVRDAIAGILGENCEHRSWWGDLDVADEIVAALVRAGHLAQPQCPVTTISINGKEPPP